MPYKPPTGNPSGESDVGEAGKRNPTYAVDSKDVEVSFEKRKDGEEPRVKTISNINNDVEVKKFRDPYMKEANNQLGITFNNSCKLYSYSYKSECIIISTMYRRTKSMSREIVTI